MNSDRSIAGRCLAWRQMERIGLTRENWRIHSDDAFDDGSPKEEDDDEDV